MVCVADAMRLENAVRPEKTTVSAAVPCAAGHALSKRFLPEVRPQLSEKERAEGRFGAKTRPEQADPSAGWRKGEIARRGPQTPRHARRRPLPRAPENGERRFHLEKMVEETRPIHKHSFSVDQVRSSGMRTGSLALGRSRTVASVVCSTQ